MRSLPRLLIFDADGTLRWTRVPGQQHPNRPGEWELMPNVRETLAPLDWSERGHCLGVASNQTGVALGQLSESMARRLLRDTVEAALGFVPASAGIEMCTCSPSIACLCRKPMPGMLLRVLERFSLPAGDALYVGDLEIDREAARRAGVGFEWAADFFAARP